MKSPTVGIFCIGEDLDYVDDFRQKLFAKYPQFSQIKIPANESPKSPTGSINLHRYWQCATSSGGFEFKKGWQNEVYLAEIDLMVFILTRPDAQSFHDARTIARQYSSLGKQCIFIVYLYDRPQDHPLRLMQHQIEKFKSEFNTTGFFYIWGIGLRLNDEILKTLDCLFRIIMGCNERSLIKTSWNDVELILSFPGRAKINQAMAGGPSRATQAAHLVLAKHGLPKNKLKQSSFIAHIRSASNLKLSETREIMALLRNESKSDAQCIFSCSFDESLEDEICLTLLSKFDEPRTCDLES
jgi:FtsZ family, C-terminal domain